MSRQEFQLIDIVLYIVSVFFLVIGPKKVKKVIKRLLPIEVFSDKFVERNVVWNKIPI